MLRTAARPRTTATPENRPFRALSAPTSTTGLRCSGAFGATLLLAGLLVGCANPGKPKPPSLNLPDPAKDLTAARIGDHVELRFTPPRRTTDKLVVSGPINVRICRDSISPAAPPPASAPAATPVAQTATGTSPDPNTAAPNQRPPACEFLPIRSLAAPAPNPVVLEDVLPRTFREGPPRLLTYRIELRNSSGRSDGWSAPVYALAGSAPPPVMALKTMARPGGVLLTWQKEQPARDAADSVELQRLLTSQPAVKAAKPATGLPTSTAEPAMRRFTVDLSAKTTADPGGTLDATAQTGSDYRYVATRLRAVTVQGQALVLHSDPSSPAAIAYRDEFPPAAPTGLAAAPESGNASAINLSWEPNAEPDLAGYRVYRADAAPGTEFACVAGCSTTVPLPAPFYRDGAAKVGQGYRYRVTALDRTGHESAASGEVAEQIPAP